MLLTAVFMPVQEAGTIQVIKFLSSWTLAEIVAAADGPRCLGKN